jgi:hypothetical protein
MDKIADLDFRKSSVERYKEVRAKLKKRGLTDTEINQRQRQKMQEHNWLLTEEGALKLILREIEESE